jgi:hypothetical protein
MHKTFHCKNQDGEDHLEDLGIDGRIIIKYGVKV